MTDLEITRLCAEAMGYAMTVREVPWQQGGILVMQERLVMDDHGATTIYHPLTSDAQAMALVKRFGLRICKIPNSPWEVSFIHLVVYSENLNRAICECVAKMQSSKGA